MKKMGQNTECRKIKLCIEQGSGQAYQYIISDWIDVVFLDLKTYQFRQNINRNQDILEINYCLSGRAECKMKDGCLQYIGEGDLFLNRSGNHSDEIGFPFGCYTGIIIRMNLKQWDEKLFETFFKEQIQKQEFVDKFFTEDECFFIQAKEETLHLFSAMTSIPVKDRGVYFTIKLFELFLYLRYIDPQKEKQTKAYTREQADIVKQIEKRMTGELSQRFTIEEMAREYGISTTTLKAQFKDIYGKSISEYMKDCRIREAQMLLIQTNQSISEIALSVGYGSQSKFGAVFKERMHITPLEFRKKKREP